MDFYVIIASIGIFQGFFLSLGLFSYKKKSKTIHSRILLGLLILLLCLHLIDSVLTYTKEFYQFPHFFAVKDPFILLYGPLIYFYLVYSIKPTFKFIKIHLLHIVPFVIFLIRILPLYIKPASYKISLLDVMYNNYTDVRDIEINLIFNAHIFIYLIIALVLVVKHYVKFSNSNLKTAKKVKPLLIIICAVVVTFSFSLFRFLTNFSAESVLWLPLLLSFCFFILAYRSLTLDNVLILDSIQESLIVESRSVEIMKRLDALMIKEKLFLSDDIDLAKLSEILETNRQYISKAINMVKDKNFTTYINEYRVEESKKLLKSEDYKKFSLNKIAEDSGFKSLSSFKRSFKELQGLSPSRYRVENKVN